MSAAHRHEPRGAQEPTLGLLARRVRERLLSHEREAVDRAVTAARRRMAADVHDLVMQDLSLALSHARALADDPTLAPRASAVVAAGERALEGAREIVSGLAGHEREPVVDALRASVHAAARNARVSFDAGRVPRDAHPDEQTHDALVHIAREAVANAIKHAGPSAILVVLEHGEEWRLRVHDEGRGFDAARARRGFGLESMRRVAGALGGSLRVTSAPGRGTTVEVVLP